MNLTEWLEKQRTWSLKTFGPGRRTLGLVAHIRKELKEIEADPTDPMEWVDVVILALDGAHRTGGDIDNVVWLLDNSPILHVNFTIAGELGDLEKEDYWFSTLGWTKIAYLAKEKLQYAGYTWPEILAMMEAKQEINFARKWPAWMPEDQPSEHVR